MTVIERKAEMGGIGKSPSAGAARHEASVARASAMSPIRDFVHGTSSLILPAGWQRRMQMKRYSLPMIAFALLVAVLGNPGIAMACNKIIGT